LETFPIESHIAKKGSEKGKEKKKKIRKKAIRPEGTSYVYNE
jgi:hypothetical protein